MMTHLEPFASLALALAAGLLIGLERERSALVDPHAVAFLGGVRTHPLFALVGGVAALLSQQSGVAVLALAFLALILLLAGGFAGDVIRGHDRGITSHAAFLLSFLLGALATSSGALQPFRDRALVVAATAVAATYLLSAKSTLHPLVQRVREGDVSSTLKFLVVALVVLPVLPDRIVGPYQVLNPFKLGLFLLLVSAISFAGYAAIRLLGPERGLGITGLVGGMVSSTAVTLAMSGRARERPALCDAAALAVMLASTVMFGRILVVVAVVNPALVGPLAYPMATGALGGLAACLVLWRRAKRTARPDAAVAFENPFELSRAVAFAGVFGLVLLGTKIASVHLGTGGTFLAGVLGGAADVDTVALSMGDLARTGALDTRVAATAVFLGAASNTLAKGLLAFGAGGAAFGKRVLTAQLAVLAAGAVGAAVAWVV
ncbi:MAG TPA: DUF4010 domain-containing protein [Anaeromyxobacter sp.]|nr:DUF4010 domain-containing protein [Anaeromyxobacter sp.]